MANNSVELNTFPVSDLQALAMLYTQNQDLKGKSVKDIAEIYYNAYYELTYGTRELRTSIRNKYRSNAL